MTYTTTPQTISTWAKRLGKTTNTCLHNSASPCSRYNAASVPIPGTHTHALTHTCSEAHTPLANGLIPNPQASVGQPPGDLHVQTKIATERGAMQPSSQSAAPGQASRQALGPYLRITGRREQTGMGSSRLLPCQGISPKLETTSVQNRWLKNIPKEGVP